MRLQAAGLVLLPLLAGCLGGEAGDAADPVPAQAGVFVVEGGGVTSAGDAPWLSGTVDANGTDVTIEMLALLDEDLLALVLLEALADVNIGEDLGTERNVRYTPDRVGDDSGPSSDFCMFEIMELQPPLEGLLARALGEQVAIADRSFADRNASWMRFGGGPSLLVTGYGFSGGASVGGRLHAGDALLFGVGSSGIPRAQWQDPDEYWDLRIVADGPMRVLVLPPALFMCGVGFNRFGGTTTAPPNVVYAGGALEAQDRYGSTATFGGEAEIVTGTGVGFTQSVGELQFGDERVPLRDASNVWRTTYVPLPAAITVQQWIGNPSWMLAGYSIPHPPELGLDGGNLTQAPTWR